ncbi:hypothetical protein [Francisella sp. SYW-9]|uniref:hypothetical protein n=1 Tax=Francisella sp. SYW-9 TaxID=2610888 RepID=UPI00123CB478|nr:hypothetical protein [Francisella sp. SYW-9]
MLKKIVIVLSGLSFFAISNAETQAQKNGIDSLNRYIEQTDKYTRDIELEKLKTQLNSLRLQNKQFQDKLGYSSQISTPSDMPAVSSETTKESNFEEDRDSSSSKGNQSQLNYESNSDENNSSDSREALNQSQTNSKHLSVDPKVKKKLKKKIAYSASAVPSNYNLIKVTGFDDDLCAELSAGGVSLDVHVGQKIFNQYEILEIHENYIKIENLSSSTYKNVYIKGSSSNQSGYGGYGGYN